jgi:sec-independent protein translocase protein TatC
MTLIEHLEELRGRIVRVGVAFILVAVVAWFFRAEIYGWLLSPSGLPNLKFTAVASPVITDIKLTLYAAFLLTLPIFIYQVWAFVAPAVGEVGRVFTYILIALSSSLFLAGVAFGYWIVLPIGLDFLLTYASDRYEQIITADTYLAFVTRFLLAFGIVFELPAATFVGARLGLVNAALLKKYRKHAVVVNFVLAAALTPGQDPFSMILMALPMLVMYELSIVIASVVNPLVPHEEALEASPLPTSPVSEDGGSEEEPDDDRDAVERDL